MPKEEYRFALRRLHVYHKFVKPFGANLLLKKRFMHLAFIGKMESSF